MATLSDNDTAKQRARLLTLQDTIDNALGNVGRYSVRCTQFHILLRDCPEIFAFDHERHRALFLCRQLRVWLYGLGAGTKPQKPPYGLERIDQFVSELTERVRRPTNGSS